MRTTLSKVASGIEWPTVLLAVGIYIAWFALTYFWNVLSPWLVLPLGAWLGAWHMSLQHEVIHRHPTRNEYINDAIGFPPIALWLPYFRYKDLHVRHHRNEWLTDPFEDPESPYFSSDTWQKMNWLTRRLHLISMTVIGRLLVAPWWFIILFLRDEFAEIRAGNKTIARAWMMHMLGVGVVLLWLVVVCKINLLAYFMLFIWPAYGLTLIRSFVEHCSADRWQDRTAVVEHGGPFAILFLFNNLHVLHHVKPELPWYKLPAAWKAGRAELLAEHAGPLYRNYIQVIRQYAWRPRSTDLTI